MRAVQSEGEMLKEEGEKPILKCPYKTRAQRPRSLGESTRQKPSERLRACLCVLLWKRDQEKGIRSFGEAGPADLGTNSSSFCGGRGDRVQDNLG